MAIETVKKRPTRLSIRALMIAVAACALLLTPLGALVRQKALREVWRKRADADRARAIALGERARAEYLARVRAEAAASGETKTGPVAEPGKGIPGTDRGLWAAITVNHPVFPRGETKDLRIELTLVNDGDEVLDPKIADSRIIIDGKELADSGSILSNGPRDARFEALPPGEHLRLVCALGRSFEEPGTYRVSWRGVSFRSPEVVFRVLPDKAD